MEHFKCIGELKELLGDKILVLDREFSYELMFAEIAESDMRYVIQKIRLAREALSQALEAVYILFRRIVLGNVRTHV